MHQSNIIELEHHIISCYHTVLCFSYYQYCEKRFFMNFLA